MSKQTTIGLNDYINDSDAYEWIPKELHASVQGIEEKCSDELFEDNRYEDKQYLILSVTGDEDKEESVKIPLPKGVSWSDSKGEVIVTSVKKFQQAINFKEPLLLKILSKYGVIKIGMEIDLIENENGFYVVKL